MQTFAFFFTLTSVVCEFIARAAGGFAAAVKRALGIDANLTGGAVVTASLTLVNI